MVEGLPPTGEDLYWGQLEAGLRADVARCEAAAGLCLLDAKGGRSIEINADVEFATASSIKIPVLLALLRRVERGELSLASRRTVRPEDQAGGRRLPPEHLRP